MRPRALAACAFVLAGCGYVGDPLPPALNIPQPVADLRAVQRGDRLLFDFTAPALTTEALAIRSLEEVDLRVGPIPAAFSMDAWAASAKPVPVTAEPGKPVHAETSIAGWEGREVLAAVRVKGRKGRMSEWSNAATITLRAPLTPPANLRAEPHPEGVRIEWNASAGVEYRVYRFTEGQPEPTLLGTSAASEYIDRGVPPGRPLQYQVQAFSGAAESELPPAVTVVPRDIFPPAAPTGLTAAAGLGSVELTWERGAEPDLKAYRMYRATGTGEFTLLADAIEGPAYSDRQVTAGTVYRYQVSAVDQAGNESPRSAIVEITAR